MAKATLLCGAVCMRYVWCALCRLEPNNNQERKRFSKQVSWGMLTFSVPHPSAGTAASPEETQCPRKAHAGIPAVLTFSSATKVLALTMSRVVTPKILLGL